MNKVWPIVATTLVHVLVRITNKNGKVFHGKMNTFKYIQILILDGQVKQFLLS